MKLEKMVKIGECKIPSLKKTTPFGRPTQGQAFRDPPLPRPKERQNWRKQEEIGQNWPKLEEMVNIRDCKIPSLKKRLLLVVPHTGLS